MLEVRQSSRKPTGVSFHSRDRVQERWHCFRQALKPSFLATEGTDGNLGYFQKFPALDSFQECLPQLWLTDFPTCRDREVVLQLHIHPGQHGAVTVSSALQLRSVETVLVQKSQEAVLRKRCLPLSYFCL